MPRYSDLGSVKKLTALSAGVLNVVVMVMNYFFSKWIIFTGKKGKELSPPEREQNN